MNRICAEMRDRIADKVSDTLPDSLVSELESHTSTCSDCRAYLESLRDEHESLAGMIAACEQEIPGQMDRVLQRISSAQEIQPVMVRPVPDVPTELADGLSREALPSRQLSDRRHGWRFTHMIRQKPIQWLSAAMVALVVLGGLSLYPRASKDGSGKTEWWVGPPAAWASQINAALAAVRGVTCREQTLIVAPDGSTSLSSTWDKFYVSNDGYRRDIYDGDFLREVQWYTPDGGDMIQSSCRYDTKSYSVLKHPGSFSQQDPVARMRFYADLLDKADRPLEASVIEGRRCVGFEIRASRYGSNPEEWVDRIWFDVDTRLPVRIEQTGRRFTGDTARTVTRILDQFDYNPVLSQDTFTPVFPQGYINAHPDDLKPSK